MPKDAAPVARNSLPYGPPLFKPHILNACTRASVLPRSLCLPDVRSESSACLVCGSQSRGEAAAQRDTGGSVTVGEELLSYDLMCQMCLQSHELSWRCFVPQTDYIAVCKVLKMLFVKSVTVCAQKACQPWGLKVFVDKYWSNTVAIRLLLLSGCSTWVCFQLLALVTGGWDAF